MLAPIADDGCCELEAQLAAFEQDKKRKASVIGFYALWVRIPRHGPRALGTDFYHCVDSNEGIYEFIKGSLRLLCFEADGAMVVCSHVFLKQSQKTPAREKKRAIAIKQQYQKAVAKGSIEIVGD